VRTIPSTGPLTVAVPFYKNSAYLRKALDSVFAQPPSDWTVLVVDNSADEQGHREAAALAASYPQNRMRFVRNDDHLDACGNFNRCIDLARTDLVAVVHGDDEVLPCYAQQFAGLAARHPEAAVLFAAVRIIDQDSRPCFSFVDWFKKFLMPRGSGDFVLRDEASLRSILRGNWLNAGAVCYRKSLMGDLRWDSRYRMTADLDLWSRVILSGRTIAGSRHPPAYAYRRHAGQTTAELNASLYRFHEESAILDVIAERAEAQGWRSAASVARSKLIVQLHLLFLACQDAVAGSRERAWRKWLLFQEVRRSTQIPGRR
jgi:glycosyltransferase involved in cell wall biosynthesis